MALLVPFSINVASRQQQLDDLAPVVPLDTMPLAHLALVARDSRHVLISSDIKVAPAVLGPNKRQQHDVGVDAAMKIQMTRPYW